MHKVMVVDDEPLVRLAVKSLVNWDNHGFHMELEAANGKQALKMLEENPDVDIVITDVNMPVMNGLELIARMKGLPQVPKVIVLSAYNDYDLVRQAFKLGAEDYILKTEMEPENILKLLRNVAAQMENGEKKKYSSMNRDTDIKYLKEKLLRDLLEQGSFPELEEEIGKLGVRITGHTLAVCFLWVDDYQLVFERYDKNSLKSFISSVNNAIYQVLNDINLGEAISLSPQEYVLVLSFEGASQGGFRNKIVDILGKIRHSLSNYVNVNVSIGVSGVKKGFESIRELYKQAESHARLRFILGKGRIIFPEDNIKISGMDGERIIGKEEGFLQALRESDREKALKELEKLLLIIKGNKVGNIDKVYPYYMELIFVMFRFLNELGEDMLDIFGREVDFYDKITRFETLEEINVWIRNITEWIASFLLDNRDMKMNRAIARAREFIKNNYGSNITLKMVSEYVGLSESHFSSIFTKNTGMTFTDYITGIRIEMAKQLMSTTSLKIYEICSRVGYANVEHFSRVFKKVTGHSPNSFKKS